MTASILQVAVPVPVRHTLDYLMPVGTEPVAPGVRVRVPLGRRQVVGVVLGVADASALPATRLRPAVTVLDREPLLPEELLGLLRWAADYYHHPIGEVIQSALPVALRQGQGAEVAGASLWRLTPAGSAADPPRAPLQRRLLAALAAAPAGLDAAALAALAAGWRRAVAVLKDRGWVMRGQRDCLEAVPAAAVPAPALNPAQAQAAQAVTEALGRFQPFLLHGVTGSGKTEVYLQVIQQVLARGDQALVLVPEIGLTPQLVARFRARFVVPIAVLHSGLNDAERLCAWTQAGQGRAAIILGTRSALLTPWRRPGVIIVDEEHDPSYKQQEGFRYHGRDLAVMRARRAGVPVVLGSATPSLESLSNARQGGYRLLTLPERPGAARLPEVQLLDLRRLALHDGLSPPLLEHIRERLQRREQALIFLNRRGYAPVWMCYDCGWVATCQRCDARLTLHRGSGRLRCHHCGAEGPVPEACPQCAGRRLHALGEGTERVEQALARHFPQARIARIDRDSTRRKGALEAMLARIAAGEADILVGTQMLSKGHDFPNVTLVGVLNADQGLYSLDFRAGEQLFQQILQVSGRAGRAEKPGQVLIQTHHPDHPLFAALAGHDYPGFAQYALAERREAGYPPYSHLALLRAESARAGEALAFLARVRALASACRPGPEVELLEPIPSPMERRAGRYRAQLLVQCPQRRPLHGFLRCWLAQFEESPAGRRVRWSLDVDPVDLY